MKKVNNRISETKYGNEKERIVNEVQTQNQDARGGIESISSQI